jgi:hypothetical protein
MPITTKVVSWNSVHIAVNSIQHYVIKFVSDLQQVSGFLQVLRLLHRLNLLPWYYWNIVESGIKHHNPNPNRIWLDNSCPKMAIQNFSIYTKNKGQ